MNGFDCMQKVFLDKVQLGSISSRVCSVCILFRASHALTHMTQSDNEDCVQVGRRRSACRDGLNVRELIKETMPEPGFCSGTSSPVTGLALTADVSSVPGKSFRSLKFSDLTGQDVFVVLFPNSAVRPLPHRNDSAQSDHRISGTVPADPGGPLQARADS